MMMIKCHTSSNSNRMSVIIVKVMIVMVMIMSSSKVVVNCMSCSSSYKEYNTTSSWEVESDKINVHLVPHLTMMSAGSRPLISISSVPIILFGELACKMFWILSFLPYLKTKIGSSSMSKWHSSSVGGDSRALYSKPKSSNSSTLVALNSYRAKRKDDKTLEFVWQGSNSLGATSQIFTGIFPSHYDPPETFSFEINDGSSEPIQVQGKFYVKIDPLGNGGKWRRTFGQKIYSPLLLAFSEQELEGGSVLLRLAHQARGNQNYSEITSVELKKLFPNKKIQRVREMNLSANQERAEMDSKRLKWEVEGGSTEHDIARRGGPLDAVKLVVELEPMEIRTFLVDIDYL